MSTLIFEEIYKYTPKGKKRDFKLLKKKTSSIDSSVSKYYWNVLALFFLCISVYLIFIARAINVQITSQEKYLGLAEKNRIREFSILPGRGIIKDRNGNVLVRNKPLFSIELNTLICKETCALSVEEINKYIEVKDIERVLRDVNLAKPNILVATGLTRDQILTLEANMKKIAGVSIHTSPHRDYLYPLEMAHLIGYVGLGDTLTPTIVGKTGIEEYYNKYISGVSGTQVVQVDSLGTNYFLITEKNALPGKDAETYIDRDLQVKAYALLESAVKDSDTGATGGAVVAQDPTTGGILALVSYPSFDLNSLSSGISKAELDELSTNPNHPFFNRAISAAYPPGSTFKLITASAGLSEGVVDQNLTIFDNGYIQIGAFIFRNWNTSGHGEVNMKRALQVSNDTYFYTVGGGYGGVGGLGINRLHKWASTFNIGSTTGIDLAGEVAGYMPDGTQREWYLGDDYISAIGQGDILTTPLQVNNMMAYFASGGIMYEPKIVKSIEGESREENKILIKDVVKEEDFNTILSGINAAVEPGGTAYPLFDFALRHDGIKLAGKTGTSEFITPQGEENTHAWFSVFGPYKGTIENQQELSAVDKPIVLTVFLEGGGSGSDDAAPIAKELLDLWFN